MEGGEGYGCQVLGSVERTIYFAEVISPGRKNNYNKGSHNNTPIQTIAVAEEIEMLTFWYKLISLLT